MVILSSRLNNSNNSRVVQLYSRQRNAGAFHDCPEIWQRSRMLNRKIKSELRPLPYDNNSPAKWGSQTEKRTSIED